MADATLSLVTFLAGMFGYLEIIQLKILLNKREEHSKKLFYYRDKTKKYEVSSSWLMDESSPFDVTVNQLIWTNSDYHLDNVILSG